MNDYTHSDMARYAKSLCTAAAETVLNPSTREEIWSGRYGNILITGEGDGAVYVGDLSYMTERLGISRDEYCAAYVGRNECGVVPIGGYWLLVIPIGGDGDSPLGTCTDTGAVSIVSRDKSAVDAAAAAVIAVLDTRRPSIIRRREEHAELRRNTIWLVVPRPSERLLKKHREWSSSSWIVTGLNQLVRPVNVTGLDAKRCASIRSDLGDHIAQLTSITDDEWGAHDPKQALSGETYYLPN